MAPKLYSCLVVNIGRLNIHIKHNTKCESVAKI